MSAEPILRPVFHTSEEKFEWLKHELEQHTAPSSAEEPASLQKAREKLATFSFCETEENEPTNPILKEFYIESAERYEWLMRELEKGPTQKGAQKSDSLEKAREKLATFVFC